MVKLGKLAVSVEAVQYLEILHRRKEKDVVKLRLLRDLVRHARDETHQMQLDLDDVDYSFHKVDDGNLLKSFEFVFKWMLCCCGVVNTYVVRLVLRKGLANVWFEPEDGPLRTSVGGEFMGFIDDNISNGSVTASFNIDGTWLVSLSSMVLTTVLQSGTNECASWLKHVTVVVAVPSSTIALKQYLLAVACGYGTGKRQSSLILSRCRHYISHSTIHLGS
nr:hypothetical protein [Tanacetum cinerariifolium]